MSRIQNLRFLSLRLEVSGTAAVVNNTKLYRGGFGFVQLQAFVPVTASASGRPLLTVFRTTIDNTGMRRQHRNDNYNLIYVQNVELEGKEFMLFELPLPEPFTRITGDLEFVFNYTESNEEGRVTARMPTNIFRTSVSDGGVAETDIELGLSSQEAAQINSNTGRIIALEGRADALEDRAEAAEERLDGIDQTLIEHDERITQNATDIAELDSRQSTSEGDITSLQNRMTAAENVNTQQDNTLSQHLGLINNNSQRITNETTARQNADNALGLRIDGLDERVSRIELLGKKVGSFATQAQLPTNASDPRFFARPQVNDYVFVETPPAVFPIDAIASNGNITWGLPIDFDTDITGKMDLVQGATSGNLAALNANGQAIDSGFNGTQIAVAQQTADNAVSLANAAQSTADTARANIEAETAEREQADLALELAFSNALAQEQSDRQAAIDQEAQAREQADTQLQANIEAEAADREAGDQQLQANLNTETANRQAADGNLQSQVNAHGIRITALEMWRDGLINPLTGLGAPLQEILYALVGVVAAPINAMSLDGLNITVAEFDALLIPAAEFDFRGGQILATWQGN